MSKINPRTGCTYGAQHEGLWVIFFTQQRNQNKSTEGAQSPALLLTTGKSWTNYSN